MGKPEENHNKKIQQAQNLTNTTAVYVAPTQGKNTKKMCSNTVTNLIQHDCYYSGKMGNNPWFSF